MSFIIFFGQERFALPIGKTRIGGAGDDALPFPVLARHMTMAVLVLTPDNRVSLWPQRTGSAPVTVNGVRVVSEPVTLTHGAKIHAAGLRLTLGDLREAGATTRIRAIADGRPTLPALAGQSEPTADSGGRLTARRGGAAVTIPDGGLVIGRDPESHVVIRGSDVSRRHAVIRASIQGYVLRDLSTNGTYVNGRRIDGSEVLGMGDVIRIGGEEFRFEADPASYEPATDLRASEPAPAPVTLTPRTSLAPPTAPRPAAAAGPLATLQIVNTGALKGRRFRLERPVVHVGRGAQNDVQLADTSVAGRHATLTPRGGTWVVRDHGSTRGTYVNGLRVVGERALRDGGTLRIGDVVMRFRLARGSDAPRGRGNGGGGIIGRLSKLWRR